MQVLFNLLGSKGKKILAFVLLANGLVKLTWDWLLALCLSREVLLRGKAHYSWPPCPD
jgi:hypothetical protein